MLYQGDDIVSSEDDEEIKMRPPVQAIELNGIKLQDKNSSDKGNKFFYCKRRRMKISRKEM